MLRCLRDGIDNAGTRIPALVASWCAAAVEVLLRPGHFLYREINTFLLQRPALDIADAPMFLYLLNSGETSTRRVARRWLFRLLGAGMPSTHVGGVGPSREDAQLLRRRHVPALLLTAATDAGGIYALRALLRCCDENGAAAADIAASGAVGWACGRFASVIALAKCGKQWAESNTSELLLLAEELLPALVHAASRTTQSCAEAENDVARARHSKWQLRLRACQAEYQIASSLLIQIAATAQQLVVPVRMRFLRSGIAMLHAALQTCAVDQEYE